MQRAYVSYWITSRWVLVVAVGICCGIVLIQNGGAMKLLENELNSHKLLTAVSSGDVQPAQVVLAASTLPKAQADMLAWGAGMILADAGQIEEAAGIWRQMDSATQAQLNLQLRNEASAYEIDDNAHAAERLLRARVALAPDNWRTYDNLGDMLLRQSRDADAAEVFAAGAERLASGAGDYLAGRAAETRKDWDSARQQYIFASSAAGETSGQANYRLAVVLRQRFADNAGAIAACERAVQDTPDFYACYELIGMLYEADGSYELAQNWYNAGLVTQSDRSYQALFWRRLGDVALKQQKPQEAASAYGEALKLKASDADAHRGLALVRAMLNDPMGAAASQSAAIDWRKSQAVVPAQWYAELGQYYLQAGDVLSAQAAFNTALAIDATNTDAQRGLDEMEQTGKP